MLTAKKVIISSALQPSHGMGEAVAVYGELGVKAVTTHYYVYV